MAENITYLEKKIFLERAFNRLRIEGCKQTGSWKEWIRILRDRLPGWKEQMVRQAQDAYDGMQILPGTSGKLFFVGIPPKWKELPVTDKEYLWSINRMYHWNTFIVATYLTGDQKYAVRMREELSDWIGQCPPPALVKEPAEAERVFSGVSPWRTLEAGIRMFEVWPNIIRFLVAENQMDKELLYETAIAVYGHGNVLYHIPPLLWPDADHNHYLMENLGLLFLTDLFPELADAPEWVRHANRELERCARNQLTRSGAQIEGCPTYHNLCMHYFCRWLIISEKNGFRICDEIRDMIRKGLDYSLGSFRPCGGGVPCGDSDADYYAVKSAVYGYRAFHDDIWMTGLKELLGKGCLEKEMAEFILEWGDQPMIEVCGHEGGKSKLCRLSFQKEIGQVSYRTSWNADAMHVHFGCRMPGNNGHAHIDPLSFDFSALGKPMLVDPGRFTYDEANGRKMFKSAKMHNCLLINDREPYEYQSSWRFGEQRDGCLLKAEANDRYFWASGIHTCYFPIIHHRIVSMVESKFLLVWDFLNHMRQDDISLYFHVDEECLYEGALPGSYHTENKEGRNILICPAFKAESKLLDSYVSEYIDVRHKSCRALYEEKGVAGFKEYAVAIVPYEDKIPQVQLESSRRGNGIGRIEMLIDGISYVASWDGEVFYLS